MENEPLIILLADDDESDRFLFKEAFEELKIKSVIHSVKDGIQLIDYLIEKNAELPHLIFLDFNMPRKNGLECLKEIRANEKFKQIPVIIYSTSASKNNIEDTFRNGANVYIKKPADFSILKKLLAKVVSAALPYKDASFNIDNFLMKV